MKLTAEQRAALLAEMRLAELFSEKAWMRRYGISRATVQRLRAEAREHVVRRNASEPPIELSFTVGVPNPLAALAGAGPRQERRGDEQKID